jgi:hypothetical protein
MTDRIRNFTTGTRTGDITDIKISENGDGIGTRYGLRVGWQWFESRQGKTLFFVSQCPDRLCDACSLLSNGEQNRFRRG